MEKYCEKCEERLLTKNTIKHKICDYCLITEEIKKTSKINKTKLQYLLTAERQSISSACNDREKFYHLGKIEFIQSLIY